MKNLFTIYSSPIPSPKLLAVIFKNFKLKKILIFGYSLLNDNKRKYINHPKES